MKVTDKAILWVDLTGVGGVSVAGPVARQFTVRRILNIEEIDHAIRAVNPSLVCFEYECPDSDGLTALSETKRTYPGLPILLITTYHSEALAIWALRMRVWDYLMKPCSVEDVSATLKPLFKVCQRRSTTRRRVIPPLRNAGIIPAFSRLQGRKRAILMATAYIETHLDERLQQTSLARQCGMSVSHFSRLFKQVCGLSFGEFVLRSRIEKALELLADPNGTVTNICYEVGFQDLSYFGRTFRRYVGMTPSEYQRGQSYRATASRGTRELNAHSEANTLTTPEFISSSASSDAFKNSSLRKPTLPITQGLPIFQLLN